MVKDRPLLGITLMIGFCMTAPMSDAATKLLTASVPILMFLTVRFGVQAIMLTPVALWKGTPLLPPRRYLGLVLLRLVLHLAGVAAMFAALAVLPLADAVAIAFVMPFIMLLLGHYALGEEVGWRRLAACAVGFVGTLLVVQPSFVEVGPPALLPVLVAVIFALFMLLTRQIAKGTDAVAVQAFIGLIAAPGMLVAALMGLPGGGFVTPTLSEMVLLGLIGVLGTSGHLLMSLALRYAPSSTLAPMQYLEIPFATLIGFLVFRDLPDGLAALGILITIVAGLYVIYREQRTAMQLAE
ncbi:MAG: DMT family transporter [Pseudomonadota bacterium]